MKIPVQQYLIPGLAVCCGLAAVAMIPAIHLPRAEDESGPTGPRAIPEPDLAALNEEPPSMQAVVAKHLFIPQRAATGQNSFPDLTVKGVFLGTERSAVFSLKSKPQSNLRVWEGGVDNALSQIIDPRDPRQPIAQFLREWNIKEIRFDGVRVAHFITGEEETYAVDYTPVRKAKDDASRGYGQGIMPQGNGNGGGQAQATARNGSSGNSSKQSASRNPTQPVNLMADRVSALMKRMSPTQQKQFMQRMQQNSSGGGNNQRNTQTSNKNSSKNNSKAKPSKNTTKKK